MGRPCGNAMVRDGSLLIGDDRNGVIYRVSYDGPLGAKTAQGSSPPMPAPPAAAMLEEAAQAANIPLAIKRPETNPQTS